VAIREDLGTAADGDDPGDKLLDAAPRRGRIGTAIDGLELYAPSALSARHRAHPTELGVLEPIDEVGTSNQQIEVEWPILAELEASESIEDHRLARRIPGTQRLVKEQAVTSQAFYVTLNGRMRYSDFPGDLSIPRTTQNTREHDSLELGKPQPVGRRESL